MWLTLVACVVPSRRKNGVRCFERPNAASLPICVSNSKERKRLRAGLPSTGCSPIPPTPPIFSGAVLIGRERGLTCETEKPPKRLSMSTPTPGASPGSSVPPPPPPAGGRPPTVDVPSSSWARLAAEEEAAAIRAASNPAAPKPFSPPPPGWEPPSLSQLWVYANRRHPYARLGYGAAVLVGAIGAWAAWSSRDKEEARRQLKLGERGGG